MAYLDIGDALCIEFSDEVGTPKTEEQVNAVVGDLRRVAQRHGFDLSTFGPTKSMRNWWGANLAKQALEQALEKLREDDA